MAKQNRNFLVVFLSVAVLLGMGFELGALRPWRDRLSDLLLSKKLIPENIVIVKIDEKSIGVVGQWPWPRAVFGSIVNRLQTAAVIGVDVNFKETSRLGSNDDAAFAHALAVSRVPVVLTAELQPDGTVIPPLTPFVSATEQGFPNIIVDPDGIVRYIRFTRNGIQSLSLKVAEIYARHTGSGFITAPSDKTRIRFFGPDGTFSSVSAQDVINGRISEEFFAGKIIFIGATASDLQDYHQTPFGVMSGVEIQANLAAMLIEGHFYKNANQTSISMIFLLAFLTTVLCFYIKRLPLLILALAGLIGTYSAAVFIGFDRLIVLDLLYPNLAILLSAGLSITIQYLSESRERKFIQDSFSRYLAPQIIHQLMHDPSRLRLGGVKENLTILFSDIRNFTSLSEGMAPERLTGFLNRYLSRMTEIVLDRRGVIDKYIGDAIMAFWGAPLTNPKHACDGILSAMDMVEALVEFNAQNRKNGDPVIDIGIGLNTGNVTVGNMGSERRFDYTVMGDNVNLASRLEGLTKQYHVNIIASQFTISAVSTEDMSQYDIVIREIDRVQVKGKKQAVTIMEVVSRHKQKQIAEILARFDTARELYYQGQWQRAIDILADILSVCPDDGPSQVLKDRCHIFLRQPVSNWNGVFEMTSK